MHVYNCSGHRYPVWDHKLYLHSYYVAAGLENNMVADMKTAMVEFGTVKVFCFIQRLVDEGIITKYSRVAKRKVVTEILEEEEYSIMKPDVMLGVLDHLNLLESVSKRAVIFTKAIYDFQGVKFPFRCSCKPAQDSTENIQKHANEVVYTTKDNPSNAFDKVPDKKVIDDFINYLNAENILTNTERSVKKECIWGVLENQTKRFQLTYEELYNGLQAFNYIKSESRRFIVFAHTNGQNDQKPKKKKMKEPSGKENIPETKQVIEVPKKKGKRASQASPEDSDCDSDQNIEAHIQGFLQLLIDKAGLCERNKTIRRTVIAELLASEKFPFPYNELVNELWSFGLLENAKKRNIVFSDQVFTMPNLRFPIKPAPTGNIVAKKEEPLMLRNRHILTFSRLINPKFTWTPRSCIVCQKTFSTEKQLKDHLQKIHGDDYQIPDHICKGNTTSQMFDLYQMERGKAGEGVQFAIRNNYFMTLTIRGVLFVGGNQVTKAKWHNDQSLYVDAGEVFEFALARELFVSSNENHSILLVFEDEIEFIEQYHVKTAKSRNKIANIEVPSPISTQQSQPMQMDPLQMARPSKEIVTLFNHNFVLDNTKFSDLTVQVCKNVRQFLAQDPKARLNATNYTEIFSYCIQIADCSAERDNMLYDRQVFIQPTPSGHHRIDLLVNETTELPPDLCEKDLITLRKISIDGDYLEPASEQVLVGVYKIESDHLLVENTTPKVVIDPNALYNVRFKSGRITHRMEHQAIKILDRQKLIKYFFPVAVPADKPTMIEKFEWFNQNIGRNPEQMQAVESIVNGSAYPSPYIIFGPPGTGKTSTIVEAICQLYRTVLDSHILVTAQSNSACDELMLRLWQALPSNDIYRIYAPYLLRKMDRVDPQLQAISNLKDGNFSYPSWDELYAKRIVVCTLSTAGRLVLARVNKRHFTHVFIDECASASEPAALIPIAGLITGKNRIYGNIVLAGDIQQLGPTLKSRFAVRLGYAKPLMERLMELPIYQKDPATNNYNPNLITKLVRSFRSHPKIIEFSNHRFYDGDLISTAHPELTDWAIGWPFLPNQQFPVIFVPCVSETKCDEFSYSTYNEQQVVIVMNYVKQMLSYGINAEKILPTDIGVISPYKKQCQKIAQRLEQNEWSEVEVGTCEMFQGREKPVIIISTVRSGTNRVGFLDNPKRLNVTITRAKALMIIIGDPYTLQNDPNWYDLLQFCSDNNGCVTEIQLGDRPETHHDNPKLMMSDFNFHFKFPMKNQMVFEEDFF